MQRKCFSYIVLMVLSALFAGFPNLIIGQTPQATTSPPPTPAEPEEFIRVETELVTVPVSVMDNRGKYVIDLEKKDFQIFEDGVDQEIVHFETLESPFTVLLLIDVSGSMANYFTELINGANVFVRQMRPNDTLMAATFAGTIKFLFKPTKIAAFRKMKVKIGPHQSGNTFLYDAVDESLKKLKNAQGRKAIVLFSDGFGQARFSSAEKSLRKAEESEALIYTVQYLQNWPVASSNAEELRRYQMMTDEATSYMRGLAESTGGTAFTIKEISELGNTFRTVVEELSRQYLIGFNVRNATSEGERREIRVRVNRPGLAVRSRESYVVGKRNER